MRRLGDAAALALLVCFAGLAIGQTYPAKSLRAFVGFAPGSQSDVIARVVAAQMAKQMGQAVVVENRVGAEGTIASRAAADGEPGYSLFFGGLHAQHPVFLRNNAVVGGRDLLAVSPTNTSSYYFLIGPKAPFKSFAELVAYSKANPGKLNFGSPGSIIDLVAAPLKSQFGLDYAIVPYKGGGPLLTALLAGEIDFAANGGLGPFTSHMQAGTIRLLFGTQRDSRPGIPKAADVGIKDYVVGSTPGAWAQPATPRAMLERLSREVVAAIDVPDIAEKIRATGTDPIADTPEGYQRTYDREIAFWSQAARLTNFQPQ